MRRNRDIGTVVKKCNCKVYTQWESNSRPRGSSVALCRLGHEGQKEMHVLKKELQDTLPVPLRRKSLTLESLKNSLYESMFIIMIINMLSLSLTILGLEIQYVLTLESFKNSLYGYNKHALTYFYVTDNPRVWKSVCVNPGIIQEHSV